MAFVTTEKDGTQHKADAKAVIQAFRQGESVVPLLDGGFAPLPGDFLAKHGERLLDLLNARRDDGTIPPAAQFDLAKLARDLGDPEPPTFQRLSALAGDFSNIPVVSPPADLTATLRHYQQRGLDWLTFLSNAGLGGILADDMGLGKTVQAISAIKGKTLVVAPTSVLHNWHNELTRFRPSLRVGFYYGPQRSLQRDVDVLLTTYAILRLDAEQLAKQTFDMAILDEAQAIKNPDSQTTRAAYGLNAGFKLTLSGTPIENRLEELWSQMHFTNPGVLGSRNDFNNRYSAEPARLRERIKPFILRRLKREVAPELPPRTEVTLRCELRDDERAIYDAVRAMTMRDVVEKLEQGKGNVMQALEALLRLRQAASHSGLIPGASAVATSSKVELLVSKLDEAVADGHKALVFSQWTSMLDKVEGPLREAVAVHPSRRLDQ